MPAAKRQQSSAMLYSLITFVGLFIITTVLAVIFYVKFEDQRGQAQESERNFNEVVTNGIWRDRGRIFGTVKTGETYLGKMVDYLDKTVSIMIGPLGQLADSSAEVKVGTVDTKVTDVLKLAQDHIGGNIDPNIAGLVPIIQQFKTELDRTINDRANYESQLRELRQSFNDAMTATQQKEKQLEDEKEQYHQQVIDITQKYEQLKLLVEQTSEERVKTLMDQLEQERANYENTNDELLRTQAELQMTQGRLERALDELAKIRPSPDREVTAFEPDGKIILIDDQAGVVRLNIGSDDHVYRGLTFSVYDRNAPIPKEGRGKAEVEVFNVAQKISTARILPRISYERAFAELSNEFKDSKEISEIMLSLEKPFDKRAQDFEQFSMGSPKRLRILNDLATAYEQRKNKSPIALNDIVANLVWDRDKTNLFVVVGEFDLDGDGVVDDNAVNKIKALIEKWGGKIADTVSVDTDFVVLGYPPQVPPSPSSDDLRADPMANEKYKAALQEILPKLNRYKEVRANATALWIPVFKYDRFLYFIGYTQQANKPGAF